MRTAVPLAGIQRAPATARPRQKRAHVPRSATLEAQPKQEDLPQRLLNAREQAVQLFDEIDRRGLFAPGRSEEEINRDIFELASSKFGTRKHWHKRMVRAGANTIQTYDADDLPDLVLGQDDLAFVDLGPVFENIEADFARAYVMGDDPEKHKLNAALPEVFEHCRQYYLTKPDQTGEEFYRYVCKHCEERGYSYGNWMCGHLLGTFSHVAQGLDDKKIDYIALGNDVPMSAPSQKGQPRHWVLEIHLIHSSGKWGGFYEDLLMPGY